MPTCKKSSPSVPALPGVQEVAAEEKREGAAAAKGSGRECKRRGAKSTAIMRCDTCRTQDHLCQLSCMHSDFLNVIVITPSLQKMWIPLSGCSWRKRVHIACGPRH